MSTLYRVRIEGDINDLHNDIPFSVGNPSVEHICGKLRLYRHSADAVSATRGMEAPPNQVCVLAVPGDMSFSEFATFLGSYTEQIASMRLVRRDDKANAVCMALLQFRSGPEASEFVDDYNGKPFSELEPEVICRAVLITSVTISEPTGEAESSISKPAPGLLELPTCPVCLERLDQHISGIITTVCNHCFHNECLQKWGDSSCPVCRYCINRPQSSCCEICNATADLWICLICGHIGCGRYKDAHARTHYELTNHCYSLEVETGRVWDYAGDGYVHRLIQSNLDGKLVEVPSPEPPGMAARAEDAAGSTRQGSAGSIHVKGSLASGSMAGNSSEGQVRSLNDDLNMLEATYASKMDAVTREYTHLLTTQLESQRRYFEEMRVEQAWQHSQEASTLQAEVDSSRELARSARQRLDATEGQLKSLRKASDSLNVSLREARKEIEVLGELNRSLIANQKVLKGNVAEQLKACQEKDEQIKDLQDQVRDLMVYLEASSMADKGSELAGGSVALGEQKSRPRGRR